MGISLTKGGNVSLTKEAGPAGLTAVTVGPRLGRPHHHRRRLRPRRLGRSRDAEGKVFSDEHFVFFNNLTTPGRLGRAHRRQPDRRGRGRRRGDQRQPGRACRPRSTRSSSRCRSTTPTPARSPSARCATPSSASSTSADGAELARYDLTEDASTETAMIFGELYRNGAEWKFRAVGQGYASGLRGIARTSASTSDTSKRRAGSSADIPMSAGSA